MKINLTVHQLIMSIQQIMLIIRYGVMESDISRHWHRTAHQIEKENASRVFDLELDFVCDPSTFYISTGKIYHTDDNWIEIFVHEEETKSHLKNEEKHSRLIVSMIRFIAFEKLLRPQGVRTIHFIYDGFGKLLRKKTVTEKPLPFRSTEYFIQETLDEIVRNLRTPDNELELCDDSVTGRYRQNCMASCPARMHCHQRRKELCSFMQAKPKE